LWVRRLDQLIRDVRRDDTLDRITFTHSHFSFQSLPYYILPDRKEVIFRLYFVDTPEEERVYADRITEQAAYLGITPDAAIQIAARQASSQNRR
jgi:hypothetical protein